MKITDIRATTLTVPLEAAPSMRMVVTGGVSYARWWKFETDEGLIGLGEIGGGGESAEAVSEATYKYQVLTYCEKGMEQ
jgi:glucarate dehydratase